MALFFLPEIGVVLTAAGQAALTAIGIGAVLSLSGDTSKEKSQAKAQVKAGACHGNCKSSKKPLHGYKIFDKRTGQIMEYGISGATRTKADSFKTENNSPRTRSKLRKHNFQATFVVLRPAITTLTMNYYTGSVIIDDCQIEKQL